jgi:hypothetical protein
VVASTPVRHARTTFAPDSLRRRRQTARCVVERRRRFLEVVGSGEADQPVPEILALEQDEDHEDHDDARCGEWVYEGPFAAIDFRRSDRTRINS